MKFELEEFHRNIPKEVFSFEFFAPFNFLFFEEKQKCQTKNLKRVANFLPPKSLSGLSDDRTLQWLGMALELLRKISDLE
jgi:hypothetical protein